MSPGEEAPGPSALDVGTERVVAWGTTFCRGWLNSRWLDVNK